ncbi:MAG: hypothetical protein LBT87_05830 [Treponema sp.]|nr:hypothetical protein [Treponema sp.]
MAFLVFLLFPVSLALSAQVPFPLAPALETACFGGVFAPAADLASGFGSAWQPDWPADIPPDAFNVKGDAALIRISGTVTRYGDSAETKMAALSPFEYRLNRDSGDRLVDFPLALEGAFFQVHADYSPSGGIATLVFTGTGGGEGETGTETAAETETAAGAEQESWIAEFPLPYIPFESPAPKFPGEAVRVSRGNSVYFVLFEEGGGRIAESWYDPEGSLAGYFISFFEEREGRRRILSILGFDGAERYHFESGAHVSAVRGVRGGFSAVYGAKGQVLEREFTPAEPDAALKRPERFAFQWDERFLLVSMRDISPARSSGPDGSPIEFRYEYTLDRRNNWLSRRETAYIARGGLLIPAGTKQIDRSIVYREEE